ncbi:MAG: TRAP transporter small permease subunit [Gammaproteobacteria bacterium]|nr:TRAP transporter small permease subunit [Gammaproteobacteria bacterium]
MSFVLKIAGAVERAIIRTGEAVAWLTFVMTVVTCLVAVLRYGLSLGWIWLQETITWMHAAVFLLAAGYTLARDEHVRVDIFYREMSPKRQAVVNLCGCLLFLLPLTAGLVLGSLDYVETSWRIHESSREAGGLIYPFPSLLKTLLPLTGVLVGLQALVICLRSSAVLLGIPLEDGSDAATGSHTPGSTAGGGV